MATMEKRMAKAFGLEGEVWQSLTVPLLALAVPRRLLTPRSSS